MKFQTKMFHEFISFNLSYQPKVKKAIPPERLDFHVSVALQETQIFFSLQNTKIDLTFEIFGSLSQSPSNPKYNGTI